MLLSRGRGASSSARVAFHSGTVEKKPKYNQLNPAIPEH